MTAVTRLVASWIAPLVVLASVVVAAPTTARADDPDPTLVANVSDGDVVTRGTTITASVTDTGTTFPLTATWTYLSGDDPGSDLTAHWNPGDPGPSWTLHTPAVGDYELIVSQDGGPWSDTLDLTVVLPKPTAQTITATYPAATAVPGANAIITGLVRDNNGTPRATAPVALQVYGGGHWNTTDVRTTTDAAGRFRLTAPTYFYGPHTYRPVALAAGGFAAAAPAATGKVTVRTPYTPRGSASAFQVVDRPWNPCRTIPVYVNMTGAKKGFTTALVTQALTRLTLASGLRFRYAGTTRMTPLTANASKVDRRSGIFIGWATPKQVPALRGSTVGEGGYAYGGGRTAGFIALDRTTRGWKSGFGGTGTRFSNLTMGGALMHELGHAVGLAHSRDRAQVMYPLGARGGANWGEGDLAGLSRVGLNGGC